MTGHSSYASRRWDALGTYVFLAVSDDRRLDAAVPTAERLLAAVDRTCSRFRTDSDLTHANRNPGRWVAVDPLLVAAVRVAVEAARATDGLVSPCLGRHLVSLGYDGDLRTLTPRATTDAAPPTPDAWRSLEVDDEAIRVPGGCSLDLGATAKAWAADLIATTVADRLGCRALVSLGGDLRISGPEGSTPEWPVQVAERPDAPEHETVWIRSGGLATSSTLVRRWRTLDGELHHLLDPRSGRPVTGSLRTATATGHTSVAANVASTAAVVLGDAALDWLADRGVAARLVHRDGSVTRVGGWPEPKGVAA